MTRTRVLPLILLLFAGCGSSGPETPSRSECESAVDRLVSLSIEEKASPELSPERRAELEKHRAPLRAAVDGIVDECERAGSPAYLECLRKAKTSKQARTCKL
jgi:hypothetical protein